MPVIINIPQDPTDLVIAGEQMRAVAFATGVHAAPAPISMQTLIEGDQGALAVLPMVLIGGEQNYLTMTGSYPGGNAVRLQSQGLGSQISNNALIATPCGALYPVQLGLHMMDSNFVESSVRWLLSGVTKDSAGATLGNCRVVIFETGRIVVCCMPVVAETISDGSGNYAVEVPGNTGYQAIAYKPGSPDVAGVTVNTIVPIANG